MALLRFREIDFFVQGFVLFSIYGKVIYAKLDSRRKRVSQLSERNEDLGNEKQYEDEVWGKSPHTFKRQYIYLDDLTHFLDVHGKIISFLRPLSAMIREN